ncbi:MarR family transcriptional regulator [Tersicoccus sp. MR15.9]|uniref:MarR family winged helix-turn-helix transcriptional regulator n=1 Tax=Tersicoccus mangrovi TaxID=3121635 RepID=UPI002FE530DA
MDHLDHVLRQWQAERPDLDTSPMGVIGRLSRASAAVDARLAATFTAHGIDAATFDVLATLVRQGPPYRMSPAELAADAMITSSAVAQRLNRLERGGWIRRQPRPGDGRGKLVEITSAGRAVVDQVLPDHLATEESILEPLSAGERHQLAQLLAHLTPST